MRALIEGGAELDVFVIAPLDASKWTHSLDLLGPQHLPRTRVHHLSLPGAALAALPTLARSFRTCRRDAGAILASAAQHGARAFAKTAYVLPKAWAWAAEYAGRFDHVLAYWGNYAGTCAYAFHRVIAQQSQQPVPFSIWLHAGVDLYRTRVFLREKLLYADNILTCCEFNVGYIGRMYPDVAQEIGAKVHVSHHGLDLAQFPFATDGRPSNRVLAVGRLARHKGFDYLLRAAAQLAARGVDLQVDVVGDGDQRRPLEALAAQLGIANRVRMRGWMPFPDVRAAMSDATLLVHPSEGLGDGLPNVVREAMAVGTPVIASAVAGIPDALSGECGVLVPPRDVDALAAAIQGLLNDPARRAAIATRARARTEEQYDLWRNGVRLAGLLRATRRDARAAALRASAAPVPSPAC